MRERNLNFFGHDVLNILVQCHIQPTPTKSQAAWVPCPYSRCINIPFIFIVPEQVPILTASDEQKDSILLVWGPPPEANGILTGYLLQYHLSMYPHNGLWLITHWHSVDIWPYVSVFIFFICCTSDCSVRCCGRSVIWRVAAALSGGKVRKDQVGGEGRKCGGGGCGILQFTFEPTVRCSFDKPENIQYYTHYHWYPSSLSSPLLCYHTGH